jgi:hypothetical protein
MLGHHLRILRLAITVRNESCLHTARTIVGLQVQEAKRGVGPVRTARQMDV